MAKRTAEANKYIKEFAERPDMKIVNGMYGPYLAVGKRNVRIPKDVDAASLTYEDCLALAGDEPAPAAKGAKKTAAKADEKAPAKAKAAAKKPATGPKKSPPKK